MEFNEFDYNLLENIPEKEKKELFLRGKTKDRPELDRKNFLEKRKKETPEDTEKYTIEAKRIMEINSKPKKSRELKNIKAKDTYAAWRILNTIVRETAKEIPAEFEEKLKNETPERTEGYKKKAQEILAKKGRNRFDAMVGLKKNAGPYVFWRVCNIMCDLKNRPEK